MLDSAPRVRNIHVHAAEHELKPGRERQLVTVALMAGQFLAAIEGTAVATAMPSAVADLGGLQHYSWAFSSYLLTSTITVPLFGKLADVHGRLRIYLLCSVLFVAGSALCGTSHSFAQLVFFRALQGIGAGGLIPVSVTLIGDIYTLEERGRMQGVFSAVWAFASIAGPLVGGAVTDALSWRWVFYFTIPFALVAGVMLKLFLAEPPLHEHRDGVRLPFDIFRNRVISVGCAGSFFLGCVLYALAAHVPMYAHELGGTARDAGVALIPLMVAWPVASTLSGRLMLRFGYRPLIRMGAITALGGLIYLAAGVHGRAGLAVALAIIGLGMGFMATPYLVSMQNAVPWNRRGVATSSNLFFRTIGGSAITAFNATVHTMFVVCAAVAGVQLIVGYLFPAGAAADLGHVETTVLPNA